MDDMGQLPAPPPWLMADESAHAELSPEAKDAAREIFEGRVDGKGACHYCAGIHASVAGLDPKHQPCPRIRRIERHPDGTVLVVEFWEPGLWEGDVIFPSDVYDEDEER